MKLSAKSLIVICFCTLAMAQVSWAGKENKEIGENVMLEQDSVNGVASGLTIVADPRVSELVEMHREESLRKKGLDGFRIQIYSGSGDNSKQEAYKVKSNFLSLYPSIEVYIVFQAPEFKVRVGNFRDKSEALATKELIQKHYPSPFIVEDFISFPEIKTEKEEEEATIE